MSALLLFPKKFSPQGTQGDTEEIPVGGKYLLLVFTSSQIRTQSAVQELLYFRRGRSRRARSLIPGSHLLTRSDRKKPEVFHQGCRGRAIFWQGECSDSPNAHASWRIL